MWISKKRYNGLLKTLHMALESNHELRKVCQCRECKNGNEFLEGMKCHNPKSDNYREYVSYYCSCEECERR